MPGAFGLRLSDALGYEKEITYVNNQVTGCVQVYNPTEETVNFSLWLVSYNRSGAVNKTRVCVKPITAENKGLLKLDYRVSENDETIKLFVWTDGIQPLLKSDKMQVKRINIIE